MEESSVDTAKGTEGKPSAVPKTDVPATQQGNPKHTLTNNNKTTNSLSSSSQRGGDRGRGKPRGGLRRNDHLNT